MNVEPSIFIVGAFPPPVHGMALVNTKVRSILMKSGVCVRSYDLASRSLDRGMAVRFMRLGRVVQNLCRFALDTARASNGVLYIGLSGGWGQAYEIAFVALGRIFGLSIFLHHHSFAYLTAPKLITRFLILMAGKDATHIALCNSMASALCRCYGENLLVKIISNSVFIDSPEKNNVRHREGLRVLGYLGNISEQKGILLFMDIVEELYKLGVGVVGRMAGPFEDDNIKNVVLNRVAQAECFEYVGPQYTDDKIQFLDSIDVLIFPSRYKNEAEPLTVHEAMARGTPILSFKRGCIGEIIPSNAGVVLNDSENVVEMAVEVLTEWWHNPINIRKMSEGAVAAYDDLRKLNFVNLKALCCEMVSGLKGWI